MHGMVGYGMTVHTYRCSECYGTVNATVRDEHVTTGHTYRCSECYGTR
jgi:predicted SprT family Zn-dependent metalloprotease